MMNTPTRSIPATTSTEPARSMPRDSRRKFTALLWMVGLTVYAVVVAVVGWKPIVSALGGAEIKTVLWMSVVAIAALWMRVFKWWAALGPGSHAVGLFWLSKAAGEWSPGRVGELSPLLLGKFRTPRLAAWIVLDRLLEVGATLGLGSAGILLVRAPNRMAILLSAAVIAVGLSAAVLLLAQRRIYSALALRFHDYPRIARTMLFLEGIGAEVVSFAPRAPLAIGITLIAGLADVWAGILLFTAFGYSLPFALVAAVKGIHAITSAIPLTPNATGVPYFAAALLLHQVGGVPSDVLAAAIALSVAITNLIFWLSALSAASGIGKQQGTEG